MSALKNTKINYLIVGTFVILSILSILATVLILSSRSGDMDTYYTYYNRVQGLKFGTKVVYEGYPVGQIEEIIPERNEGRMRFKVALSIKEGWDIPQDSLAAITTSGLLSGLSINIRAGESQSILKPGDQIRGLENADLFNAVSTLAEQVGTIMENDIRPLLASLNTTVNAVGVLMAQDGSEITRKIKGIIDEIGITAPTISKNLESFTRNLDQSGTELTKILSPDNRVKINTSLDELVKIGQTLDKADQLVTTLNSSVNQSTPNLNKAMSDLRFVMETLSRHVDTIAQNMEATSRNMHEFSRHIRQNPGLLLGGTPPQDQAQ